MAEATPAPTPASEIRNVVHALGLTLELEQPDRDLIRIPRAWLSHWRNRLVLALALLEAPQSG